MKSYKYLDIAMVISVVTLLLANFAGNSKITQIGGLTFTSGVIFFPVSYLLGDVLTEVYGYSKSRRVIWISFGALVVSAIIVKIMILLPPAREWHNQKAFETIFGNTWRTVIASIIAFWAGEFANSFTLAKLKIITSDSHFKDFKGALFINK